MLLACCNSINLSEFQAHIVFFAWLKMTGLFHVAHQEARHDTNSQICSIRHCLYVCTTHGLRTKRIIPIYKICTIAAKKIIK